MSRYRSCMNCPAYKYVFLSETEGKCALQFEYSEDREKIVPLEDCTKPKNITEMNIFAKKRGVNLPGFNSLMSEKEYNIHCCLRKFRKELLEKLKEGTDDGMM